MTDDIEIRVHASVLVTVIGILVWALAMVGSHVGVVGTLPLAVAAGVAVVGILWMIVYRATGGSHIEEVHHGGVTVNKIPKEDEE